MVRGGAWLALSTYANIVFGFACNLVLTRLLRPDDFGAFALAMCFFSLAQLRPKSGIDEAFTQRRPTTGALVGTYLVLNSAASVLTCGLAAVLALGLRRMGYAAAVSHVVVALAAIGLVSSCAEAAVTLLFKELQFGAASLINSVTFALSYLPAFWVAWHGGGCWSLVAQQGVHAVLLAAGIWTVARRGVPHVWQLTWRFDRQVAAGLLRFGVTVGMGAAAGMFLTQFDNFLVGTFVGLSALGLYDRAYRIAQWPHLLVGGVISRVGLYAYSRLQDDAARLRQAVAIAFAVLCGVAWPVSVVIFVAAPELVRGLYGERWLASVPLVRLLVLYAAIRPLRENLGTFLIASGQPRRNTLVGAAECALLVMLGVPLTLGFQAAGTCVTVVLTYTVGAALAWFVTKERAGLAAGTTALGPVVALALALAAGTYAPLVAPGGAPGAAARLLLKSTVGLGAYFLILRVLGPPRLAAQLGELARSFVAPRHGPSPGERSEPR